MASPLDPVLSHHTSQERQPAAVPELPNNKPHQLPKQSHTEDHTEQIEATSGEEDVFKETELILNCAAPTKPLTLNIPFHNVSQCQICHTVTLYTKFSPPLIYLVTDLNWKLM